MAKDLALDDSRYAWALSIFFFGYLIMEVPSNMVLTRCRPRLFLPGIMLVWGILSATMAVCKSYGALLAFRFALGCIEAGFFPGVLFLLSCFYKSEEIGKRIAIFYTAAVLSGAFGGVISGAITSQLHNRHGISGWRWLVCILHPQALLLGLLTLQLQFIIEGCCTICVSIIAFFVLLDFPATATGLSLRERQLATIRLTNDSGKAVDKGNGLTHWQAFRAAISDPRTYAFMLLYMMDVGAGTIAYFIPQITKSLGYTSTKAQYMTCPIYLVAAVVLVTVAWSSDRNQERRWHVTSSLALGLVAAVIGAAVSNAVVQYVMLCFVAAGIWSALPLILSWTSNTVTLPVEKRAIVLALVNAFGNLSSVWGSRIWPSTDGPLFHIGWGVTAGFLGSGMILAAFIPVLFNRLPERGTKSERESDGKGRTPEGGVVEL
jgi:MFS family permease